MHFDRSRFELIRDALSASGKFRPSVQYDAAGNAISATNTYLDRYPRESDLKFARRNAVAWYSSPLMQACSRFVSYLSRQAPVRSLTHPLYQAMADDIDGRGNAIDVFWRRFMVDAKARGSMLMLVDMPAALPESLGSQMAQRVAPYWLDLAPELVTDYQVGDDGLFDVVSWAGSFAMPDGSRKPATYRFDRTSWRIEDQNGRTLAAGDHPLGECPVIAFTESGEFPYYGSFSSIADLSRRLFNLQSELDEILRSQTFSLLTMQVPDGSTDEMKLAAAKVAGETIGTANLLVHVGSTPSFIAPDSGPASTYLEAIKDLRAQINEIAMAVETPNAQESGIALQMRFQSLNAALSAFSGSMEDFECRAWSLSARWLGLTTEPTIMWPRDFTLSDVSREIEILSALQTAGVSAEILSEQQRRIVSIQFAGLPAEQLDRITQAIDERVVADAADATGATA